MSLLPILWMAKGPAVRLTRPVLSAAYPNILLLLVIAANIAWWREGGWLLAYPFGAAFPFADGLWYESLLLVGLVLVIDLVAISLFARNWRRRRWGRKPREIEAATRYFNG